MEMKGGGMVADRRGEMKGGKRRWHSLTGGRNREERRGEEKRREVGYNRKQVPAILGLGF